VRLDPLVDLAQSLLQRKGLGDTGREGAVDDLEIIGV
jgi:hypothetical protein